MALTQQRLRTAGAAFLSAGLALASGCGQDKTPAADSARVAPVPQQPASIGSPACPHSGHWSRCQVAERLKRAGLVLRDTIASGDVPAIGATPTVYQVGKSVLVVFLFDDTLARSRAAHQLDTARFIPQTSPLTIISIATKIENDNLLALLFSKNDQQRERVSDALSAGPPLH